MALGRVMVTGGGGFLGSHVVEILRRRGVTDVVAPRSREVNLTDWVQTRALFESSRPDVVIHLAAKVGGIRPNRLKPGTFFRENMAMGMHVLEAARLAGVKKVVVAASVCAYPKITPVPFKEEMLWEGYPEESNAPYGVAKKALWVMAEAYRREFGSNDVVLFPANMYGPRDNFDLQDSHVVPAMIRKFVEAARRGDDAVTLWGDGSPTREFLYVEDAARAFVLAAERYDSAEPVNVGTGKEIAMKELATAVARATGYEGTIVWDTTQPNGQPRRMLDVARARDGFGFTAEVSLDEGLRRTIAWYREHGAAS